MRISCVALALNTENELAPDLLPPPFWFWALSKVGFGPLVCLYLLFEFSTLQLNPSRATRLLSLFSIIQKAICFMKTLFSF